MSADSFTCYLVRKLGKDQVEAGVEKRPLAELPAGDVLIRVAYSSLNYKDALAATGHPGVARNFPHVPGIDAAGSVVESSSADFSAGQQVLVTGFDLGAGRWGGWSQYIRVPAEWVVPLPSGLSLKEAMIYGTAGFTAALCVDALQRHPVDPKSGEVVVTGSTGGVGIFAVKLLAALGYNVVAVTGKKEQHDLLMEHGAARVVEREAVEDQSNKPMIAARWVGAVDTVGGNMLSSIIRSSEIGGCVSACGMVGGVDLPLTVYPFILRGVTLAGIDSAWTPKAKRNEIWKKLASTWKPADLADISETVKFDQLAGKVQTILKGQVVGRTVVEAPAEN